MNITVRIKLEKESGPKLDDTEEETLIETLIEDIDGLRTVIVEGTGARGEGETTYKISEALLVSWE